MTIITTSSKDHKSEIPPPEVSDSSIGLLIENEKNEKLFPKLPAPSVVVNSRPNYIPIILAQRRRRSIWLALLSLLLLIVLLLGFLCLYKNLLAKEHHDKQTFFCGVRFLETTGKNNEDFELLARSQKHTYGDYQRHRDRMREKLEEHFARQMMRDMMSTNQQLEDFEKKVEMGEFEQKVELGDRFDYEKIVVPTIGDTRKATILHDFNINYTAIIDKEQGLCFLLPLNRTMVLPPKDFWDLLLKLKNGYYVPDTNVVRERYRVLTPALKDFGEFGPYIADECKIFDTYKLAREGEPFALAKRSACELIGNSYCLGDAGSDKMLCFSIQGCV